MCSAEVAVVSDVFTSLGYQEDEIKLNSPSAEMLEQIWWDIIGNEDHYVPSFNVHTNPNLPEAEDLPSLKLNARQLWAPRSVTKLRHRYYFDTRLRDLFKAKVEVRLEPKDGAFKQVIKMGNGATIDNPMMGRPEYPARLRRFRPRLTAIDKKVDDRKATIDFLKATVKGAGAIKPLIRIESQRRKLEYHPEGNRDITIEVGIDVAVGSNATGYSWPIYQLELEVKSNETAKPNSVVLIAEMQRLQSAYPELVIDTTSKPTSGFVHMDDYKISGKNWGRLPKDRFVVTDRFKPVKRSV